MGQNALNVLQTSDKPALWDADALNLLALNPEKRQNRVMTPHPGEAARLLSCSTADIESDRLLAVRNLAARYGGVAVLKGAGTLIADEQGQMAIADVGNAGMPPAAWAMCCRASSVVCWRKSSRCMMPPVRAASYMARPAIA